MSALAPHNDNVAQNKTELIVISKQTSDKVASTRMVEVAQAGNAAYSYKRQGR